MSTPVREVRIAEGVVLGRDELVLIAGPCVVESEEHTVQTARALAEITRRAGVPLIFKASFDKANRTSLKSFRGPGIDQGLQALERVKREVGVPVLTDIHEPWQAAQAGVDRVARSLPPRAHGLRVYYEVSRGPYAAGASSFLGETLARLGVQNIVPASLGPFPKLNPEYIVKANPDLIIVSQDGVADMVSRPGWSDMRAVRERRICALSSAQTDVVVRPGPLLAEGARILADCIVDKGLSK